MKCTRFQRTCREERSRLDFQWNNSSVGRDRASMLGSRVNWKIQETARDRGSCRIAGMSV